ncbi:MAG TPA: SufS family cysteine desulfurase, partial [Ignavibacteriales bacterium]|nr:SufS family cysteine desulfurase [Ignavibacteriales bacterium]
MGEASVSSAKLKYINASKAFDVDKIRADFPILQSTVRGKPLVYLDNAATSQKPTQVINSLVEYYTSYNSNIHRGVHYLSEKATSLYEEARVKIKEYINAISACEVVYTRGATESINLIVSSYGGHFLKEGDEIIISAMEHHANIVPWQILCQEKKTKLRVVPINDDGEFLFDEYLKMLNDRTKIVSVAQVSNTLGTINPVKQIVEEAHKRNIITIVDGAQAIPHMKVDVQDINSDFYVFSGHKLFGPTGIGILYGKAEILKTMPPYQAGGDMIRSVTFEKTIYNDIPNKFEAGTPHIAGGIGLGAAIDYMNNNIDFAQVEEYEKELLEYGTAKLLEIDGLRIIGTAKEKAGVISFVMDNIHPHDIGTILDSEGVA